MNQSSRATQPMRPRCRQAGVPTLEGQARASAYVCEAVSCLSARSHEVLTGLGEQVVEAGLIDVAVKRVGCLLLCAEGPLVQIPETGQHFSHVTPDDLAGIMGALASTTPGAEPAPEAPFFSRQLRIATENSGRIDPESLKGYVEIGGFDALRSVLTSMTPAQVREEITRSGLRGRGGAGYPVGLKWDTVAQAKGSTKYVICNADEGDPGAFMDRSVLESDPYRVLEGMAIAAYAVGGTEGYIYCRAEHHLAISRLRKAIRAARRAGYLGAHILETETEFGFEVDLRRGAGAFVCGEETALIASVQGGRGTPQPRPPYPAVAGLWDQPTLINNVETLANIAPIIRNGGAWFAGTGTVTSKGTKVFALAGQVVNTGLVEVPMGTTLREIVFDIGGGIVGGRAFKAVQTGGPSGDIPTLCHLDGLSDTGSCRLCVVEVAGSNKLTPACTTLVCEGMDITTASEHLAECRRTITEMLFLERNHICAVCVANNQCELQNLAEGAHTWDVMGSGIDVRVVTDMGTPWGESTTCTSCGKCVQGCPTGALFEKGPSIGRGQQRAASLPALPEEPSPRA